MASRLVVSSVLLAQGCLLTDPPPYEAPEKTVPILTPQDPPITQVLRFELVGPATAQRLSFSARVRSEDLGDPVHVFLYADYLSANWKYLGETTIPAATLDTECPDTASCRSFKLTWDLQGQPAGCHSATIVATHQSNVLQTSAGCYQHGGDQRGEQDESLACFLNIEDPATLTWWVNLEDPSSPTLMNTCPSNIGGVGETQETGGT